MRTVLTYDDYAALPNDGWRYEIHDGELSVTPTPTYRHQWILAELLGVLRAHVAAHDLGEVVPAPITVVLAETSVVEPDIVYIEKARMGLVSARGTIDGAPTLAIEILSPSTARIDRQRKRELYERYGVPYYWIVDPDMRTIDVYRATSGVYGAPDRRGPDALSDLPPFAGLTIDAARLWR
ncbi:MAG: Uma2 family endonuclease [Candidatus Rokubacteria bacterium]|nr:Uma2 family endonuclease [Candidatus Rokubacteria bacterium]